MTLPGRCDHPFQYIKDDPAAVSIARAVAHGTAAREIHAMERAPDSPSARAMRAAKYGPHVIGAMSARPGIPQCFHMRQKIFVESGVVESFKRLQMASLNGSPRKAIAAPIAE